MKFYDSKAQYPNVIFKDNIFQFYRLLYKVEQNYILECPT